MKIITYNINGLKSALSKGLGRWITASQPGILCLQETRKQITQEDIDFFKAIGYNLYWNEADKKGYSGVAILSKEEAIHVKTDFFPLADQEGRIIQATFDQFTVINTYIPSGASKPARQLIKYEFLENFFEVLSKAQVKHKNVLVTGDFNICHQSIDLFDPVRYLKLPGFLELERKWMDQLIDNDWIDTFRHFNPNPLEYTWWSNIGKAKEKNLGFRIDYILSTKAMIDTLSNSRILKLAKYSDHAPVLLEFHQEK